MVQAPAPPRPIDGGLPTTALLAHIAAAKFAWHLPLHRQTQMLAGYGIKLDRSTLVHWIGRTAWWLQPLHALLTETGGTSNSQSTKLVALGKRFVV